MQDLDWSHGADRLVNRVDDDVLKQISDHNKELNNTEKDNKSATRASDYDPVNGTSRNTGTYLLP